MPFLRAAAVSIVSSALVTPTADAINRWDITTGFGPQQEASFATATGNFSLNAPVVRIPRLDILSGINNPATENCFYIVATKVGNPSSLTLGAAALVKQVRQ
jgi:hypothetical protein